MGRGLLIGLLVAAMSASTARADRAVAPTETLSPGTVELSSGIDLMSRSFHLDGPIEQLDGTAGASAGAVAVRGWLAPGVWIAAGQRFSLGRRLEIGGVQERQAQRELLDLDLELGAILSSSRHRFGATFGIATPVNDDRVDVILGGISGLAIGARGEAFATVRSILRSGDTDGDRGNTFELAGGYHQRLGPLSLLGAASAARSLAHPGLASEGFWVVGGRAVAALEVAPSLTASLELGHSLVSDHAINAIERSGGRETTVSAGLAYAWDLSGVNFGRTRHLEPSAIAVEAVRVPDDPDPREWQRALTHAVPALRLATLEAERAAGAPGGVLEMSIVVDEDGRVIEAEVADGIGAPRLALAARDFFLRRVVFDRGRPGEVAFSIRFRPSSVARH